jgi:hypothetical protein
MVLIERDDVIEDTHNISQLKKNKLAISIPENEMRFIDYRELERKIELNIDIDRYSEYKNNIGCIAEYIRRIVKDQK